MIPAEQAALALWIEIEPYSHEPWASNDPGFAVKRIAAAIEQARRAEREACAMIADAPEWDWHSSGHGDEQWPCLSAQTIAAAIRARAQEE